MNNQGFESKIERLMKQDFSAGTEAFREDLLSRCLAVLNVDEGSVISDEDLDMLAAAGNPYENMDPNRPRH